MENKKQTTTPVHPSTFDLRRKVGGAGGGPRGLRNNNPGNIKQDPNNHWKGLADDQPDPTFVKFKSLDWGYRAMWILLNNYWHIYGCKTLRKVIYRWATPNENNSENYLKFVASKAQIEPGALLPAPDQNYQLWQEIIVAMVRMEGTWTEDCHEVIRQAYRRAFGK